MTKKHHKAVALRYNEEQQYAPSVAATGKGTVADKIIQKAIENNILIQEDASLVELLAELNINETIPEELYHAVAEVFAFIYHTDQRAGNY